MVSSWYHIGCHCWCSRGAFEMRLRCVWVHWKIEVLGTAWNTRLRCSLAIPKKFRCSFEVQSSEFWWVPKKFRCLFEERSSDSRLTQWAATWDWLLPNTKVRYSTRSSAFEGACGAKWLGTRTMCPEGTVADKYREVSHQISYWISFRMPPESCLGTNFRPQLWPFL